MKVVFAITALILASVPREGGVDNISAAGVELNADGLPLRYDPAAMQARALLPRFVLWFGIEWNASVFSSSCSFCCLGVCVRKWRFRRAGGCRGVLLAAAAYLATQALVCGMSTGCPSVRIARC